MSNISGEPRDAAELGEGAHFSDQTALADRVECVEREAEQPVTAEVAAQCAQREHDALVAVFDEVRRRSTDGQLVEPASWLAQGLVPAHLTGDEFEMVVYEYLSDYAADQAQSAVEVVEEAPVFRTATKAVGVPQLFGGRAPSLNEEQVAEADVGASAVGSSEPEPEPEPGPEPEATGEAWGIAIPDGYELVELEGELTLVPLEESDASGVIDCRDIVMMMGEHSYYLYARDIMTDTYARWAFLAREDDRIATFVECVRNESRQYPRPMAAAGLQNEPFNMTAAEVEETWQAVSGSKVYPDIGRTVASNGGIYYYSTTYLSDPYAASLAEWHAVERQMYR